MRMPESYRRQSAYATAADAVSMPENVLMCTIGSRVPGLYSLIGEYFLGGDSRVRRYVEVV